MEVAIIGASTTHGYMLTCKQVITCSRGLTEGVQTWPAVHTGICLTGVTDSSNRDDEKNARQHPEGWEETEIHTQTCPQRQLPCMSKLRSTSAASRICTEGSTMCAASLPNRARKENRVKMTQLLYYGFLLADSHVASQFHLVRNTHVCLW